MDGGVLLKGIERDGTPGSAAVLFHQFEQVTPELLAQRISMALSVMRAAGCVPEGAEVYKARG